MPLHDPKITVAFMTTVWTNRSRQIDASVPVWGIIKPKTAILHAFFSLIMSFLLQLLPALSALDSA